MIEEVFSKEATEQLAALEARAAEEAAAAAAANQRKAAEAGQEAAAAEGKAGKAGKASQGGAGQEKAKAAAAKAAEEEVAAIRSAIADQPGEAMASDFTQVGWRSIGYARLKVVPAVLRRACMAQQTCCCSIACHCSLPTTRCPPPPAHHHRPPPAARCCPCAAHGCRFVAEQPGRPSLRERPAAGSQAAEGCGSCSDG